MEIKMIHIFILLLHVFLPVYGFYLPGKAPVNYCKYVGHNSSHCQSHVDLHVNRLRSNKLLRPIAYNRFDFCDDDDINAAPLQAENLGQIIFGDRIQRSMYKFEFSKNKQCVKVCSKSYHPSDESSENVIKFFKSAIEKEYAHDWRLDDVPVTWCYTDDDQFCTRMIPMGSYVNSKEQEPWSEFNGEKFEEHKFYLFNHFDFMVSYQSAVGNNLARITKVTVHPSSMDHKVENGQIYCDINKRLALPNNFTTPLTIHHTYSITFVSDDNTLWSDRWGYILNSNKKTSICMFSTLNSLVVILFLSAILFKMMRSMKADINTIKDEECEDDFYLLMFMHGGDLFRSPKAIMLLSVFVGTGAQLLATSLVTLLFAAAGFLSPANSGALATCFLLLYICFGMIGGFSCARIYKVCCGKKWFEIAIFQSVFLPGSTLVLVMLLNIVHWVNESSAALPYDTVLIVIGLWLGLHVPFTLLGAYLGFRRKSTVVQVSEKAREIPRQKLCVRPVPSFIMGGILPFGSIFIQNFFILNSIWFGLIYYMFGYLLLTFFLFIVTVVEVTLVLAVFHIRSQDYNWWWRSFVTSASTGVYLFAYAIYYYIDKTPYRDAISTILFFGYSFLMVSAFTMMTGSIGFLSTLYLVKKIHRSSKNAFVWSHVDERANIDACLDAPNNDDDEDLKVEILGQKKKVHFHEKSDDEMKFNLIENDVISSDTQNDESSKTKISSYGNDGFVCDESNDG